MRVLLLTFVALAVALVPTASAALVRSPLADTEAATVLTLPRPLHEECQDHVCRDRTLIGGDGRRAFDLGDGTLIATRGDALAAIEARLPLANKEEGAGSERGPIAYAPKLVPAASLPPSLPFRAPIPRPEPQPAPEARAPTPVPAVDVATPRVAANVVEAPELPAWQAHERAAALAIVVAALAAYSRITGRNAALTSPVRAKIVEIVQREGVVPLPKLAEALQLGRTTIEHHLRVLDRCGILAVSREGRAVIVSVHGLRASAPPPEVRRSPACQALLAILAARPDGLPREELHRAAAEIPLRTRNHAMRALFERGLVVEQGGRVVAARSQA